MFAGENAGRAARAASLALLALGFARFAGDSLAYLRSPYSRDYGEGVVLTLVRMIAERGTYFGPVDDYPMVHGNYPPVFLLLSVPAMKLLGPSLAATRALSLAATLAAMAVVFAAVRRATQDGPLALSAALLFIAPWFVVTWAPMGRVDMLACAFSAAGLWLWPSSDHEAPRGRRHAAAACFVLGIFTKQTALLAPAAVALSLLGDPAGRRRLPSFILSFVLPAAVVMLALVAFTRGQAWTHLVTYTAAADYSLAAMRKGYETYLLVSAPLLVAILLGLQAGLEDDAPRDAARLPFTLYWLLSLVSLVTTAKAGAAQNYLVEPWLATVILAALSLGALRTRGPAFGAWPVMLVAAAVALVTGHEAARLPRPIRNPREASEYQALDRAVEAASGPILSENLSVLVRKGKPVLVEPFGMLLLSRKGLWRPDRLAADCEAGRFDLIVYEDRLRDIPGLDACLDARYEKVSTLGPYDLFRPRAPSP